MPPAPAQAARVSTLELFFDLVFVFTLTQLTGVLADHPTPRGLLQVVLLLGIIWWMDDRQAFWGLRLVRLADRHPLCADPGSIGPMC